MKSVVDARKEMRKRGGLPSPEVRRVSLLPDLTPDGSDALAAGEASPAGQAALEREAAARAAEELHRLDPKRSTASPASKARGAKSGGAGGADAAGASRRARGWLLSSDTRRVLLALGVLLLLCH